MELPALEQMLLQSLSDFKLDNQEKIQFRNIADELSVDKLRFIRNKAFELATPYIENGGAEAMQVFTWLERVTKVLQPVVEEPKINSSAWFSPGDDCRDQIIYLIKRARLTVRICVFTISDNRITEAILDAHKRQVSVDVISDNDKANDRGSDIEYLASQGVNVYLDHSPYHMHHKFMIVDDRTLLNGSFNWTRSASADNEENILITEDQTLVALYTAKFNQLLTSYRNT